MIQVRVLERWSWRTVTARRAGGQRQHCDRLPCSRSVSTTVLVVNDSTLTAWRAGAWLETLLDLAALRDKYLSKRSAAPETDSTRSPGAI